MFTEGSIVQQAIDQAIIGAGFGIVQELLRLLKRRWQTDEIQRHAPEQHHRIRGFAGLKFASFEGGEHEIIERLLRPSKLLDGGTGGRSGLS